MGYSRRDVLDQSTSPQHAVAVHAAMLMNEVPGENELKRFLLELVDKLGDSQSDSQGGGTVLRSIYNSVVFLKQKGEVIRGQSEQLMACVDYLFRVVVDHQMFSLGRDVPEPPLVGLLRRMLLARIQVSALAPG